MRPNIVIRARDLRSSDPVPYLDYTLKRLSASYVRASLTDRQHTRASTNTL